MPDPESVEGLLAGDVREVAREMRGLEGQTAGNILDRWADHLDRVAEVIEEMAALLAEGEGSLGWMDRRNAFLAGKEKPRRRTRPTRS